jgi:hypothetical protein
MELEYSVGFTRQTAISVVMKAFEIEKVPRSSRLREVHKPASPVHLLHD